MCLSCTMLAFLKGTEELELMLRFNQIFLLKGFVATVGFLFLNKTHLSGVERVSEMLSASVSDLTLLLFPI